MTEYTSYGSVIAGEPHTYTDSLPIILGNVFYIDPASPINIDDAYVVGGRVWVPGHPGGNNTVRVFLYEVPAGDYVNPIVGRTPLRQVDVALSDTGWTTAHFDTPWKVPAKKSPWMIAYRLIENNTYYGANLIFRDTDAPFNEGGVSLSKSSDVIPALSAWRHGYYCYDNTAGDSAGNFATGYAVDSIVSDSIGASEDTWSLWNGSVEVPVTVKLWTGSTEIDFTTEVAT